MPDAPQRPVARKKPVPRRKPAAANAKAKTAASKPARAPTAPAPNAPRPTDPARRRAVVRGALLSVLLVGVLFAFVYPTQTFLDQRSATTKARGQLDLLRAENAKLADATKQLQNDDEIARIAREFYGLVKPGEKPFVILPAPTTTTTPPAPAAGGVVKATP